MRVLYMFGLNEDGQCGVPTRPEYNGRFFPVPIAFPLRVSIQAVSAGSRHTLALSTDGEVFSWGWGNLGQLGHGETRSLNQPTKIPRLKDIIVISAGGVHSACINSSNYCYTWGSCTYGQLGLGIEVTETRKCIVATPSIVTLRSGGDVKGERYICTIDNASETSMSEICFPVLSPDNYPSNALRATRISCGGLHTAAIDLRGNVYCWGKADSGQTGYADWYEKFSLAVCSPRKVEGLGPRTRGQSTASPVPSPRTMSKTGRFHQQLPDLPCVGLRAVDVHCGGFHTMVTMEDGSVYAMGKQDFGVLGTGFESTGDVGVEAPTQVRYSPVGAGAGSDPVSMLPAYAAQVSAGGWHTAIVNAQGQLFLCGKGEYGRLGQGDEKSRMWLTRVSAPLFKAVLSNVNAPLLPSVHEEEGQSKGGGTTPPPPPPSGQSCAERVTCVSAGGSHTLWATEEGRVYAVGRLDGGRLGMGYATPENPAFLADSGAGAAGVWAGQKGAKKRDRLLSAVDITPMLYTCCVGATPRCGHRVSAATTAGARALPEEPYRVLQVSAGGSHSAVLVDFPNVTHDGALEEFIATVEANILCEEARVDPKTIPTVK